jgi:hypothetical protein
VGLMGEEEMGQRGKRMRAFVFFFGLLVEAI